MKRIIALSIAVVAALALPTTASAAQITVVSNLSNGANVCPIDINILQAGGKFNSIVAAQEGSTCTIPNQGQGSAFFTPTCRATARVIGGAFNESPAGGALGTCPQWAMVNETFAHWEGTARFRLDITGTPYIWRDPCGAGVDCFTDGGVDVYTFSCHVGPSQKVRDCTYRRNV